MDKLRELNLQSLPRLEDGSVRYPRGWFLIGLEDEFPAQAAKPLHYFGKDWVAWRSASGVLSVWEAHCAYSGAHLGISGRVDGELISCSVRGAQYATDGRCVAPPRGENSALCAQLRLRALPTDELNGLCLVWYDPRGNTPDYRIEQLPEYKKPGWSDWHMKEMDLPVHPREVIDNIADKAHFVYVHGFDNVNHFENQFYAYMATQHMRGRSERGENESVATYFGPAYQITWMVNQSFESRLLNAHTPVDETRTQLWFGVMLKKQEVDRSQVQLVGEQDPAMQDAIMGMSLSELLVAYADSVTVGFEQDMAVWQRKLYRAQPILADGDGPIARCRRWYAQFYQDRESLPSTQVPPQPLNPHIKYRAA